MVADGDAHSPAPSRSGTGKPPFHPESLLGTTLDGRYRISAHLASGGMGAVFRAEHVYMRKDVALKVLRPDLSASADLAERFRRESEIAASLNHENIVRVTDFGRSPEGYLFLAMELLEGESLFERLRHSGPLSPGEAVPILLQVCAGLEAAHRRAVVHRDLKPENIFLHAPQGGPPTVKILDFGIAKISDPLGPAAADAGMVVGTPEYLSPEQAFGQEVDSRADIYAVGIVAWRMLAGRHPFPADNPRALVMKQATEPVPALGEVRPDLAVFPFLLATVARACAKDPDRRPGSAAELAGELARSVGLPTPSTPLVARSSPALEAGDTVAGESVTVSLPTPLPRVAAPQRRRRLWRPAGVAALAVAALVAAVVLVSRGGPVPRVEGLLAEGKADQARELAAAVLEEQPGDARLRALLGLAQERSGRLAAALDSLETTAQLDPAALDGEALLALASALGRDRRGAERAAKALARVGPRAAPAVAAVVPRTSGAVRLRSLELLRALGAEDRVDLVASWAPLLVDPDCDLRRAAVRRLSESGSPSAIPYLKALAERREEHAVIPVLKLVRADPVCGAREAEEALQRLQPAARRR
ncbi:MAG TPA: protein kinase [Anaeromyxobacteraceae bacterium]|nr:protein kinase [Anaeromyxobacteraceae bacterium]